jgi:hypothetical protein
VDPFVAMLKALELACEHQPFSSHYRGDEVAPEVTPHSLRHPFKVHMYRSSTKFFALVSFVFACGSPGELDEARFPAPGDTGYPENRAGGGGMPAGSAGSSGLPLGGTGGSGTGGSGTGGSGTGGSGTGGSVAAGGSAGSTGQGGTASTGSCPDDIAVLFNRPGSEGGCQGTGCHVPGPDGQRPDLTSPDVASRLLNVMSSCNGRPYIGATDSFLENKLVGNPPDCGGYPMPFFMTAALSAADKQCMLEWIDEVAAGM